MFRAWSYAMRIAQSSDGSYVLWGYFGRYIRAIRFIYEPSLTRLLA